MTIIVDALLLLFGLLIAHAVCDFALQTDAMAKGKNRHKAVNPDLLPPGQKVVSCWPYWLTAHALVHAGGVWAVTESPLCAAIELAAHWLTDFAKCENWTTPHLDQRLHFLARLLYVCILYG